MGGTFSDDTLLPVTPITLLDLATKANKLPLDSESSCW